jgi:hypothetical protein
VGRFQKLSWTPRNHPVLNIFPYSTPLRALMFGTLFTLIFAPITLGIFELAHIESMPFWHFFAFKLFYAVIVGMIVTPINALWVLTRPNPKT